VYYLVRTLAALRMLAEDPRVVYDRLRAKVGMRAERLTEMPLGLYAARSWEAALVVLEARLGPVAEVLEEPELRTVEAQLQRWFSNADLQGTPFPCDFNADRHLARLCYAVCRLLKPAIAVETGVAFGVTSAYVLKALEKNGGEGALHSVDLPPLHAKGAERFVGAAIPGDLRGRWSLYRGASKRVLPGLLGATGGADFFVHDSLHTYRNMRREFETVMPRMRAGGMIVADDIGNNRAFEELKQSTRLWIPIEGAEENATFGIALK
jgi:predicted O-methyltransferase YrrM